MNGPCDWPVNYAACMTCTPLDGMSAQDRAAFEEMATDYLWNWTLKSYGVCHGTIRPAPKSCLPLSAWGEMSSGVWPDGAGWYWADLFCGLHGVTNCACHLLTSIQIPGPVVSIEEILIDGAVLSPIAYRIDNTRTLVRVDGGAWPWTQDLTLPTTSPDTWSITYDYGREVPIGGAIAAGVLACELAKAACRDSSCALPQRLQTITRQGVTMAMIDAFEGIEKGHTGIWLIDSWISSVTQPTRPSQVYSPDLPNPRWRRPRETPPPPVVPT